MAKNNYDKIRSSKNELEAILRIRGISKVRFGKIINVKGSTIEKYIDNPFYLRYFHMARLATFLNIDVRDVIDIIEVDIPNRHSIIVEGEEDYDIIQALPTNRR
jgi:hypothetical protein|tara:strand:- start:179 stop:490 length:312 start_codon:yes stop_codon:yes gene_type:complete